jgi:hypothetical protein
MYNRLFNVFKEVQAKTKSGEGEMTKLPSKNGLQMIKIKKEVKIYLLTYIVIEWPFFRSSATPATSAL